MSRRLPRAASIPSEARLPPTGLLGLDPTLSRLVEVPETALGSALRNGLVGSLRLRTWHILDNGELLKTVGANVIGTILCVHGNPTWSYLWRSLLSTAADVDEGADAWRVIAVDQLDMGFSERTGIMRPLARRVQDLDDLTTALGLDGPVVTLGHDWGGVISLGWAVDHPKLLDGVILLNTAVHQPQGYPIPAPLRLALGHNLLGLATVTTTGFLESTLALAHPPLSSEVKRAYRAPYRGATRRGGIGGFVADIPVDDSHESTAELDRIAEGVRSLSVPALLLWGPTDPIFSDRYLNDLVDRLPHADIHRFETAGHLVAEDVDYAGAALSWLADQHVSPADQQLSHAGQLSSAADVVAQPGIGHYAAPPQRLWRHLDDLRENREIALVEMAPASGGGPRTVSWKLLSRRIRQIASGLDRIGVRSGDRVSLLVQPGADLTAVLYACLRIGAIVIVADAGLGLRGLTRAVRGSWPDHVIGALPGLSAARAFGWPGQKISTTRLTPALAKALDVAYSLADIVELGSDELLPPPPDPSDIAAVLFTSGSTGPAKGVVYTHRQVESVRDALAAQYGIGVGTGLVAGFAPFALFGPALGTRSVTPDMDVTSPKSLTAVAIADAVAAVDASVVFLSPAAIANVTATAGGLTAEHRRALAGVKTFLSAGAPVSERLLSAFSQLMPNASAHTPYGMTEGLLMTDISLDEVRKAAASRAARASAGSDRSKNSRGSDALGGICVGRPTATTRIRISALDVDGNATGMLTDEPNVTGEIVASAPHVKNGYDRLWLTDRASRRDSTGDTHWHRTADVGHFDEDGLLWIEGRLQHVIVTADGVVTPVGLEQAIEGIERVRRAAIVGIGPRGNQQLVAVVETTDRSRKSELADARLAGTVRSAAVLPLAAVFVVPRLPTDIRHNSKIDRSLLSRWANAALAGGRMIAP